MHLFQIQFENLLNSFITAPETIRTNKTDKSFDRNRYETRRTDKQIEVPTYESTVK